MAKSGQTDANVSNPSPDGSPGLLMAGNPDANYGLLDGQPAIQSSIGRIMAGSPQMGASGVMGPMRTGSPASAPVPAPVTSGQTVPNTLTVRQKAAIFSAGLDDPRQAMQMRQQMTTPTPTVPQSGDVTAVDPMARIRALMAAFLPSSASGIRY